LEYIQCTHCNKRYAANDKARAAVGKFTPCRNCKEDFLVVILDTEARGEDQNITISSEGWDPSQTMSQVTDHSIVDLAHTIKEDDTGEEARAREVLASMRKEKRNKNVKLLALVLVLLAATVAYFVTQDDSKLSVSSINQLQAPSTLTHEEIDANNAECRAAAAQKWITDYTVMHTDYTAEKFVLLLKTSQRQAEKINAACKNKQLIAQLIDAATAKIEPAWIQTDITILRD